MQKSSASLWQKWRVSVVNLGIAESLAMSRLAHESKLDVLLVILDTGIVKAATPAVAGFQVSDSSSWLSVKVPSFFLYEAAPLGAAIVACRDSFHCPWQR